MKTLRFAVILLVNAVSMAEDIKDCTVRFQDNGVCACSIHDPEGPVKCENNSQRIEIQPCYCAYYDQHLNKTLVGRCYYSCYQHSNTIVEVTNSTEFNDQFCDSDVRTGFFCYQCRSNYGLGAYSYVFIYCVPCQYHGYRNWLQTFAIALLPLTLFYIVALLLRFNITSSTFSGIILVVQCITSSPLRTYVYAFTGNPTTHTYSYFVKIFYGILEILNLDFFRLMYSPVCLHPKATFNEIICLDYIIALYPFFLIFITYLLITAYDREYKLLIWVWKPFKVCLLHYHKTWNIHTSLIEIFASFILLSSVKILQVSSRILSFIIVYDLDGNKARTVALATADIKYFSLHHLPFALLAILISSVFLVLPLLLLVVYPCRCFHRCLNRCGLRLQALHIFMDAFQGSYRLYPRDMRYFSAFFLFLRVLMLVHAEIISYSAALFSSGMISLASAGLVAVFQPYKVSSHNTIDSVLMLLMGVYFLSCNEARLMTIFHHGHDWHFSSVLQSLSILLIVLYAISALIWKVALHKRASLLLLLLVRIVKRQKNQDVSNESFNSDRGNAEELASVSDSSTPLLSGKMLRSTY